MTELDNTLRSLDPARHLALHPREVDAIWSDIQRRSQTATAADVHERPRLIAYAEGHRVRAVVASGAAVVLLAALGTWIGANAVSTSNHSPVSSAQRLVISELRGAVDVAAHHGTLTRRAGDINIPAAHYQYAVSSALSSTTSQMPVYPVSATVTSTQLSTLASAVGAPAGGSWTTASNGQSAYTVGASQGWTLSVAPKGLLPTFAYQVNSPSCSNTTPGSIAAFNAVSAALWSNSFLTSLGYSGSNFSAPSDAQNGWLCGAGSYWDFTRSLRVDGTVTSTTFEFQYSSSGGTLLSANGVLLNLGTSTQMPLTSPSAAASEYATTMNAGGSAVSGVPQVQVTLSTSQLEYSLYHLSSGGFEYVPTYVFTGTCSANTLYCDSYNFPQSAINTNA